MFLDRDGTLGGDGDHCHPEEFTLYPFAAAAIRMLGDAGFAVVVFTMQTAIAAGRWTEEEFRTGCARLDTELAAAGASVDRWYRCPHAIGGGCACAKPGPGMLDAAAADLGLDLSRSWVVGDTGVWDIGAGRAAGCRTVLVRTGWGERSLGEDRHLWAGFEPDHVVPDLLAAAHLIVATLG